MFSSRVGSRIFFCWGVGVGGQWCDAVPLPPKKKQKQTQTNKQTTDWPLWWQAKKKKKIAVGGGGGGGNITIYKHIHVRNNTYPMITTHLPGGAASSPPPPPRFTNVLFFPLFSLQGAAQPIMLFHIPPPPPILHILSCHQDCLHILPHNIHIHVGLSPSQPLFPSPTPSPAPPMPHTYPSFVHAWI